MSQDLKIVFFGTPEFAVTVLRSLTNFGYNIVAAVTQPEKPAGRARIITPSPVKKFALEKNILVLEPHNLKKDERAFENFKHLNPDVCVVAAYGKIIPSRYLNIPKYGSVNVHPSRLPKYRGPSPVQTAILNGDAKTGTSIMLVDEKVDHGPLLASQEFSISNFKFSNHEELAKELFKLGAKLLIETLPKYVNGEIKPQPQDHSQATFTKKLTREDGRINWDEPAKKIYDQILALNPEPGTWTTWNPSTSSGQAGKVINISNVTTLNVVSPQVPGTVVRIDRSVAVATKTCYLILKQIQLEGGKEMDTKSFINGHPDFLGSRLE